MEAKHFISFFFRRSEDCFTSLREHRKNDIIDVEMSVRVRRVCIKRNYGDFEIYKLFHSSRGTWFRSDHGWQWATAKEGNRMENAVSIISVLRKTEGIFRFNYGRNSADLVNVHLNWQNFFRFEWAKQSLHSSYGESYGLYPSSPWDFCKFSYCFKQLILFPIYNPFDRCFNWQESCWNQTNPVIACACKVLRVFQIQLAQLIINWRLTELIK